MNWTVHATDGIGDPYLVWSRATGWRGHGAAGRPDARVPVLIELANPAVAIDQLPIVLSGLVEVPGLYRHPADAALRARFCTATIARDRIAELAAAAEVRRFEFSLPVDGGPVDQLASPLRAPPEPGQEVVIGVIDRGCAFLNTAFRRAWTGPGAAQTRIEALWDQSARATGPHWRRPAGVGYGREIDRANIDALIARVRDGSADEEERIYRELGVLLDARGELLTRSHGTHVADAMAGLTPRRPVECSAKPASGDLADSCRIVFVSLPSPGPGDTTGAGASAFLLDGVRYILDRAGPGTRVVINMSVGIHAGPHDGSSMISAALEDILDDHMRHDLAITVAAGNSAEERCSTTGELAPGQTVALDWQLQPDDPTESFLELWWTALDGDPQALQLRVVPPSGLPAIGPVAPGGTWRCQNAAGAPACMLQHLRQSSLGRGAMALLAVAPNAGPRGAALPGRWRLELYNAGAQPVAYDAWIQRDEPVYGSDVPLQSEFAGFADDRRGEGCEVNDLARGRRVISVGALRLIDGQPTRYTARNDGASASRRLALVLPRVDADAFGAADESDGAIGLFTTAVRSDLSARMGGTSLAAPVVARQLVAALGTPALPTPLPAAQLKARFLALRAGHMLPDIGGRPAYRP